MSTVRIRDRHQRTGGSLTPFLSPSHSFSHSNSLSHIGFGFLVLLSFLVVGDGAIAGFGGGGGGLWWW